MGLFHKKDRAAAAYDPAELTPVIRSSICTGEKTAGFLENSTGKFREVTLIRDDRDLEKFRKQYGIEGPVKTIY